MPMSEFEAREQQLLERLEAAEITITALRQHLEELLRTCELCNGTGEFALEPCFRCLGCGREFAVIVTPKLIVELLSLPRPRPARHQEEQSCRPNSNS